MNDEEIQGGILRIALAVFVLLMFIILGCNARAQALPDAPQPKQQVHAFMGCHELEQLLRHGKCDVGGSRTGMQRGQHRRAQLQDVTAAAHRNAAARCAHVVRKS